MTKLEISGITCANCARHVTDAIQSAPGVRSATVSLQNNSAVVHWNSGAEENIFAVVQAVKNAGYEAKEIQTDSCGCHASPQNNWQIGLWLGIVVTAFLMIGEWGFVLMTKPWFQWFSLFAAGVVQIFSGAPFYRGAWRQLKIGGSNMDTLVALGSTTAFGYSAWALLSGHCGHLYFMEAAAIITLISAGHWLEARVSDKAGGALKSLLNLAPQTARIQKSEAGSQKSEIEIPVAELKIGDEIVLRPGDCIPVDGIVIEGESAVDESALTGESVPVDKKNGGELFAGTVNLNGRLVMRVTATGEETALANVIAAVQRAQTSRADIQRLGDRVSSVFVPVVVAIAIAAGLWWGLAPESAKHFHDFLAQFLWTTMPPAGIAAGFIIASAILIVACPCAMGLATPAAIMAGANAAARRGILIRDGVALEKAGKITAIIFDKTGTLTFGKPEVAAISEIRGQNSDVRILAAALAKNSAHPISQAIAKNSEEKTELSDWKEIRGSGIEAKWQENNSLAPPKRGEGWDEGILIQEQLASSSRPSPPLAEEREKILRLGSLRWLKEIGVDLASGEKFISEWSNQGATIVGLAAEKQLLGLFAVRDTIKPNAANVVGQLQQQGLKIFLVTGDNSQTAASIAKQVGIASKNVFAEVRPEQKAEFVKKLQSQGEQVAFVGDGINDAPALTQADLGIAVSRASDIAREAADIILLKSEIEAVPESLELARATLRTIKQNLFWAFFYNALGVPLAALGFISPIFCAAAMGFSDLIVIGNALRLLRWRK
ncbi:MAG TPA: cation-translocating P-type ATPase [Methylomirabilota bacterium]|nr:cation-translocating P-type ATPase [Methylomirabilota bacterium]